MSDVLLRTENLHTRYGKIEALHGVSLEVRRGEIVTLIGANGAGKTTLLMTICGSPHASAGKIWFQGDEITHMPTHKIMQSGIAVAPEGRRVFPTLTVLENLQMGAFFESRDQMASALDRVFELFPRLKERISQRGGTMSGGEQQMLAIGRALMSRPKLLLLDEPSLGLAPMIINQIFKIIDEIRNDGVAVFLVEQNAHKALALADRGYVLENGQITLVGDGKSLLHDPEIRRAYLGG